MVKIADAQHNDKFVVDCGRTGSVLTELNRLFPVIVADTNVLLRAKAAMLSARLSHRNSVRPSVCHTGGSGKNGPS